jgi:DNA repair photolyase
VPRRDGRDGIHLQVLGDHLDAMLIEYPGGRQVPTRVLPDASRSVLNHVDSPDLPFSWSLNPYRGCEHGCVYCYARPFHEMIGLSCGLDFETTIVAKHDAPRLLRKALQKPSWEGEMIALSGVTDAYQPVEKTLRITRGCLEVMAECGQPVGIVTKGRLVLRDLDLLQRLAAVGAARVAVSVTTLDDDLARRLEPRASSPRARLETIRRLTDAGVPAVVMLAPVIPGLTDHEAPAILEAAADAGAVGYAWALLRLPHQVEALFTEWLERHVAGRASSILAAVRDTRNGALHDGRFGSRMRGAGARAESIAATIAVCAKRCGLAARAVLRPTRHRAPGRRTDVEDDTRIANDTAGRCLFTLVLSGAAVVLMLVDWLGTTPA